MAVATPLRLTVEEYLEWEEANFEKHEYIDGEVRCMAGATGRHNRIMMNLAIAIGRQLDHSTCFLLSSEMKVKVGDARYLYPDLCAVCGPANYEKEDEMELLNPVLVIEVTSPSSNDYDRGYKRDFYFDVSTIEAYLIINQHRVYAELYTRQESGWFMQTFTETDDLIPLAMLDCELPMSQVYRGINMTETEAD